ncbi:MAG: SURF1 family cytochrome oxidase biogenesis protein [Pseudomonadota bacterium]
MLTRLPILPTLIVVAAAATMVALGVWQIGRAQEKDSLKAAMIERPQLPAIDYPFDEPEALEFLYRRMRAQCDEVRDVTVAGGKDANGRTGWTQIATCWNAANESEFAVQIGLSGDPSTTAQWRGGAVVGLAKEAPDPRGMVERLFSASPQRPAMIVSDEPKAGLLANAQPDPEDYKNSSWAYAGQWFFFAITALVIYGFAVRSRVSKRS